jgi:hypothetical protein
MQQSFVKFYYFVVQILLNMFRALLCPLSGARQTAVAAPGFRTDVEVDVFSALFGLLVGRQCLPTNKPTTAENTDRRCTEPQTLNFCIVFMCPPPMCV